jgi:hypothetical protein
MPSYLLSPLPSWIGQTLRVVRGLAIAPLSFVALVLLAAPYLGRRGTSLLEYGAISVVVGYVAVGLFGLPVHLLLVRAKLFRLWHYASAGASLALVLALVLLGLLTFYAAPSATFATALGATVALTTVLFALVSGALVAGSFWALVLCGMRSNPSIERTASGALRALPAAAHVVR